jgi:hypothetical protein
MLSLRFRFGPIFHRASVSFICQNIALGLQQGSTTQVAQKYAGTTVPQPSASSSKRAQSSQRGFLHHVQGVQNFLFRQSVQSSSITPPSIHFSTVRIDLFIVGAGQAEGLGVHVAAAVSPHVEFPAIHTQGRLATIAKHDGRFLMTPPADLASICNNHLENSPL